MKRRERLARIAKIIEDVDNRIMAVDGPIGDPREFQREVTDREMKNIYRLASGKGIGTGGT